ncbi:MAG: c-type cytochrome [Gammaproteobacteria bacterium]|nr:c-type cytochrome [Gammaproteobacteria bacterium]
MKLRFLAGMFMLLSLSLGSVQADEGADLYQAKGCVTCHGAAGISPAPIWPNVAGQHKQYLVAQMKDIKTGKRNNGMSVTMQAIIAAVSDEEIEKIADWLSKL